MPLRVWSWLVSLSILWGGSFFFAKVAVSELEPLTVVLARVGLAALGLNLVLAATDKFPFRAKAPWRDYAIMGVLNNAVPFSLIFWAQTQIPSALPPSSTRRHRSSQWSSRMSRPLMRS